MPLRGLMVMGTDNVQCIMHPGFRLTMDIGRDSVTVASTRIVEFLRLRLSTLLPLLALLCVAITIPAPPARAEASVASPVLEAIKSRNSVRCAVQAAYGGYATLGTDGVWRGFMVDYCRAIAAAVLGNPDLTDILHTESSLRFQVVAERQVDVLLSGTTVTLGRSTAMGFSFPGVYLYDGQGFITHRETGITALTSIRDAKVCVIANTTSIQNLRDYISRSGAKLTLVESSSDEGAWSNFLKRRCDLYTNDRLGLRVRAGSAPDGGKSLVLLPDIISREPLGPMVRSDDPVFATLLQWLLNGLIAAEDLGVTQQTISQRQAGDSHDLGVILGTQEDYAAHFGVAPGWIRRAVMAVGNAGEIYDRNLGIGSPLKVERGLNDLWSRGGLMYPLPLR